MTWLFFVSLPCVTSSSCGVLIILSSCGVLLVLFYLLMYALGIAVLHLCYVGQGPQILKGLDAAKTYSSCPLRPWPAIVLLEYGHDTLRKSVASLTFLL